MYLDIRKGKDRRFYIMQGFRIKGGGTSTKVYMKLGTESKIIEKYGCADAEAWARLLVFVRRRQNNRKGSNPANGIDPNFLSF